MKTILLALFVCILHPAVATNYYFSSVAGDDSRTSIEASNPSTPWKTINKLNSFFISLQAGDSVLFKRGETFFGTIVATRSGIAGSPIVIGAYGSGEKPIISCFNTVTGWNNVASNVWESKSAVSIKNVVNVVSIDGKVYAMGRTPNLNTSGTDGGYWNIDSHTETTTITSSSITSSANNWVGAQAVVRVDHYTTDTSRITSHTGNTITFPAISDIINNYGFFIQNDVRTLDQFGEWFFNPTTKTLKIYSSGTPTHSIKVSNYDTAINLHMRNYITVSQLRIEGANMWGIYCDNSDGIIIDHCEIQFIGDKGVEANDPDNDNLTITNCSISDCLNFGIDARGSSPTVISNNKIKRIGMFAGHGGQGTSHSRGGIYCTSGNGHTWENNIIDSTGYVGMKFPAGNNILIKRNVVSHFNLVIDDGGGIYSGSLSPHTSVFSNRRVTQNIVFNGVGAKAGTTNTVNQSTHGIYLDDGNNNTQVDSNTVFNVPSSGIYIHNGWGHNIHHNTLYNNGNDHGQLWMSRDNPKKVAHPMDGLTFTENILVSKTASQYIADFYSAHDSVRYFGKFDNNVYARPLDDLNTGITTSTIREIAFVYSGAIEQKRPYNLKSWKEKYATQAYDRYTVGSPKIFPNVKTSEDSIRFEFNPSSTNKTVILDGTYIDSKSNKYSNSIIIPPYGSAVLFKDGTSIPVTNPKHPKVSIISPNANSSFTVPASVEITATATDEDGTIAKVEFYDGQQLIGTKNSSPYTYYWQNLESGNYSLTVKATDNSGLVTISQSVSFTVANPKSKNPGLQIGPNPVKDKLYIFTNSEETNLAYKLTIFNISGIKLSTIESTMSSPVVEADVSLLPRGIYLIQYTCGDTIINKKFIKQ